MSERLAEKSCVEFADVLASKAHVPGGGGASAFVGALAVSLCSMAANLTSGKKKYAQYEDDIQRIIKESNELKNLLLEQIDADAEAFDPLQKAYSIPKDQPNRADILEKVGLDACQPALSMMRALAKTIELLEETLVKGSVMMVSDVGCGAYFASAAMNSASLNIFINTKGLDCEAARELERDAKHLLEEYIPRANAVANKVMEKMTCQNC